MTKSVSVDICYLYVAHCPLLHETTVVDYLCRPVIFIVIPINSAGEHLIHLLRLVFPNKYSFLFSHCSMMAIFLTVLKGEDRQGQNGINDLYQATAGVVLKFPVPAKRLILF